MKKSKIFSVVLAMFLILTLNVGAVRAADTARIYLDAVQAKSGIVTVSCKAENVGKISNGKLRITYAADKLHLVKTEAGDGLKEQVFVDMTTKTVFKADIPSEGIYNRNGKLVQGDVLENGDMVKIYGDSVMTRSIPAQYPGVTKMQRMGRATLEEAQPYQQIVDDLMASTKVVIE